MKQLLQQAQNLMSTQAVFKILTIGILSLLASSSFSQNNKSKRENFIIDLEVIRGNELGTKLTIQPRTRIAVSGEFSKKNTKNKFDNYSTNLQVIEQSISLVYYPFSNYKQRMRRVYRKAQQNKFKTVYACYKDLNRPTSDNLFIKNLEGLFFEIGYNKKSFNYLTQIESDLITVPIKFESALNYKGVKGAIGFKFRIWRFNLGASYQVFVGTPTVNDPNNLLLLEDVIDTEMPISLKVFHEPKISFGLNFKIK